MNVKVVILLALSFLQLHAEIPFTQIKGLDGICKDADFDPIHAYDLLYSNTIKHMRFYGNYGVLIDPAAYQDPDAYPKFSAEYIVAENEKAKKWRHPYFTIKKDDNADRQSNKNHEYPFDAMSALAQWLFPSPTKTQLLPNRLSADVVGEMSRNKEALVKFLQIVSVYKSSGERVVVRELEDAFYELVNQTIQDGSEQHFIQQAEKESAKSMQGATITKILEKEESRRTKFEKQALEKHAQKILSEEYATNMRKNVVKLKEQYANKLSQRIKKECELFFAITYDALRMTGCIDTVSEESKSQDSLMMELGKLYPEKAALYSILGFVWMILDSKEELLALYQQCGLLKEDVKDRSDEYTKEDYNIFKLKILANTYDQLSHVEKSFTAYGYMVYEALYPKVLGHKTVSINGIQYADCNETAYMNWFRCLLWDNASRVYVVDRLNGFASHYIQKIKDFFNTYTTDQQQDDPAAHTVWAEIMNSLQDGKTDNTMQGICYSKKDASGKWYEFDYVYGYITFLNIFGRLFNNEVLKEPWCNQDCKSEEFKEQAKNKLNEVCAIFSQISGKQIIWKFNDGPVVPESYFNKSLELVEGLDNKQIGDFTGGSGHMEFNLIDIAQKDEPFKKAYELHKNIFFTPDGQFQNADNFESMDYWHKALSKVGPADKPFLKNYILRMIECYLYSSWYALRIDGNSQIKIIQSIVNGMEKIFITMNWLKSPLLIGFLKEMDVSLGAYWYSRSGSTNPKKFFPQYYLKKYKLGQSNINTSIDGYSALMIACQNELCDAQDVQYAVDLGADVNQIIDINSAAVMFNLTLDKLDVLLKNGLDVNMYVSKLPLICFWYRQVYTQTPPADLERVFNIIKKIIDHGAYINLPSEYLRSRVAPPGATLLLIVIYEIINVESNSPFFAWNLQFINYLIRVPNINFHIKIYYHKTPMELIELCSKGAPNKNQIQWPKDEFKIILATMQKIQQERDAAQQALQSMIEQDKKSGYDTFNMSKTRKLFLATPQNIKKYRTAFLELLIRKRIDNLSELENILPQLAAVQ